jgi:nucleotide-binding universal stress UspA family protein
MKIDHILFPVDFSEQSRSAAPFVRAMARRLAADVVMLNVLELPPIWYGSGDGAAWVPPFDEDELREEARGKLEDYLAPEFAGVSVRRVLAEGDPARQIVCQAKTQAAGLIMMPTHGYGPYRSLLLGSVTAKVLHDAECPVWTGVHTAEFTSHFPEHFDRILCGVERDPKDVRVIRWAADFAAQVGAEVRLIHVIPGDPEIHEFTDRVYREQLFEGAREALQKIQYEAGTNLDLLLRLGKPARIIHAEACSEESNLVVVGRGVIQKAMGRLRSTTYAIIRESPCPVLSV